MPSGQRGTSSMIQDRVADLIRKGSPVKHFVTKLNDEDPVDMILTLPDLSGSLFLKVETTSRTSKGRFGEWLVIEFPAPRGLAPDPRLHYLFGCFDPASSSFSGPVYVVPSSLIQSTPYPNSTARSSRISFKARLDAVNQEWSEYAVEPEQLGSRLVALLAEAGQVKRQAA
jgi:hypothetical protein